MLVSIYVELDGNVLLTLLQGELTDAVLAEYAEAHLLGVHTWNLDDVFL